MQKIAALQFLTKKIFGRKNELPARVQKKAGHEDGFTIVEILVALIIISVLMGAVGFAYFANVQKARVVAAKSQIKSFETALTNFFLDTGRFPETSEGLGALVAAPSDASTKWNGPYLTGSLPKDPWGNEYIYMKPASNNVQPYEIRSYNRDGANGGTGDDEDIVSWSIE